MYHHVYLWGTLKPKELIPIDASWISAIREVMLSVYHTWYSWGAVISSWGNGEDLMWKRDDIWGQAEKILFKRSMKWRQRGGNFKHSQKTHWDLAKLSGLSFGNLAWLFALVARPEDHIKKQIKKFLCILLRGASIFKLVYPLTYQVAWNYNSIDDILSVSWSHVKPMYVHW